MDTYGYDVGTELVDRLLLGTLAQGPGLTDLGEAVVVADDDDGDLTNGTPHGCELLALLAEHGLASGALGVVVITHDPIEAPSSYDPGYTVEFEVADATPDCSGLDPNGVHLWWTSDPVTEADLADDQLPPADDGVGPTWFAVPLTQAGSDWSGVIPRQLAGTHVSYFMDAWSLDGSARLTTHDGALDRLYAFWVGDRQDVWCEDFEDGAPDWTHAGGFPEGGWGTDQWELGAPDGTGWDPSAPFAGANVAGTVLGDGGQYTHDNAQYLHSPAVSLAGIGRMPLFSYRRWLTVEDGIYDHAVLRLNGATVWENGSSAVGGAHTLDRRWVLHDLTLADFPEATVQATFTLQSDPGLEFGGWNLDDVCVQQLADVPGHYRARDLVASDDRDDGVQITWSGPWIAPLQEVRLRRRLDDWPSGPDDGELLFAEVAAAPGTAWEYFDADVTTGETWHYAAFASPDGVEWPAPVAVLGENADFGGIPEPGDSGDSGDSGDTGTSDSGDSGEDSDDKPGSTPEKRRGCGCDGVQAPVGGMALLGLALALRRRARTASPPRAGSAPTRW